MSLHFDPIPRGNDNAFAIDDKGAPGDSRKGLSEHFLLFEDTVFFAHGSVRIAQQGEGEV